MLYQKQIESRYDGDILIVGGGAFLRQELR